jgi:site-specific DNA-adenine methylase
MMALIGNKNNKDLFDNLLGPLIPNEIELYIEPFGGEFGLYELLKSKSYSIYYAIYNDINTELYERVKLKFDDGIYRNRAYRTPIYFNLDYKEIFKMYDDENSFFYCDPVYLDRGHYYENHTFHTEQDHIELSEILKNIKGRFLLSYQDRPLMRELYKNYNFYKYTGTNFISKPEIAITNY